MKKIIFTMAIVLSFMSFMPVTSAKFKDCWGKWQTGTPGPGDCYAVGTMTPDTPVRKQVPSSSIVKRRVITQYHPNRCLETSVYSPIKRRWIHYYYSPQLKAYTQCSCTCGCRN